MEKLVAIAQFVKPDRQTINSDQFCEGEGLILALIWMESGPNPDPDDDATVLCPDFKLAVSKQVGAQYGVN